LDTSSDKKPTATIGQEVEVQIEALQDAGLALWIGERLAPIVPVCAIAESTSEDQ
jgi:hypothetical protein